MFYVKSYASYFKAPIFLAFLTVKREIPFRVYDGREMRGCRRRQRHRGCPVCSGMDVPVIWVGSGGGGIGVGIRTLDESIGICRLIIQARLCVEGRN